MSTRTATLQWLAITAILATGLIHLGEARDAFGDARYKGLLFVANGVGALAATAGIYRNRRPWGWWLGLLVTGGAFTGYVVSRTVGLPGLAPEPEAWFEPAGLVSLVFEALFILVFIVARRGSFRTLP